VLEPSSSLASKSLSASRPPSSESGRLLGRRGRRRSRRRRRRARLGQVRNLVWACDRLFAGYIAFWQERRLVLALWDCAFLVVFWGVKPQVGVWEALRRRRVARCMEGSVVRCRW
jgi:hypothetical protein